MFAIEWSGRLGPVCLALTLAVSVSQAAGADEKIEALADYTVASWSVRDGLPSTVIWAITQDSEGYLWLGTDGGLVRFDGVRFVVVENVGSTPFPRARVVGLYLSRDGSFWIGFAGGVSRIRHGELSNFGEREGLPSGVVRGLVGDASGRVYVATNTGGLFEFDGNRWQKIGSKYGLPESSLDSTFIDRAGNFLVGTSIGIFQRRPGEETFRLVDAFDDVGREGALRGFSQDASGQVWVTDFAVGFRKLGERRPPNRGLHAGRGSQILHDRAGSLWVATSGQGLWRVRQDPGSQAPTIETARVAGSRSIFEDRDGNIWSGSDGGLMRLTKPRVTPVTSLGPVSALEATADGSVWASTAYELARFSTNQGRWRSERIRLPDGDIKALRVDEHGTLWAALNSGLVHFVNGRPLSLPVPRDRSLNRINAIASNARDSLWISDRDQGLFLWEARRPEALTPVLLPDNSKLTDLYTDRSGRLWFSSTAGRLGVVNRDGRVVTFGPQEGLRAGPYHGIYEDRDHILWVGDSEGLSRLTNDRFVRVNDLNRFRGFVTAIVEDVDGDLWLATPAGIAWVRRSELNRAASHPAFEPRFVFFDGSDGSAGVPIGGSGSLSGVRASDGSLWFVTGRGLTVVDSRSLKKSRVPTKVKVEETTVDEHASSAVAQTVLPPRTTRLQIDYSAVELTYPEKIRFRYRLEGFDAEWIDAGRRRQALYTHLPPRTYSFRVVASNVDGSWNEPGAVWEFSIAPMFYQTAWFAAVCALVLGFCTWAAWEIHLRHVRRQFALLLGERVRLSRELHDTLLQSLVGIAVQVGAVANTLDASSTAKGQIVRIRKQVEEYIREARHSIWNLRTPILETRDLASALRDIGERATVNTPVAFEFKLSGTPSRQLEDVEEQLLRIGQEAVLNAVHHAQAHRIHVELEFGDRSLTLRVTDDGIGFDTRAVLGMSTPGDHYGLVTMKERAEQIGSLLTLTSEKGSGTLLEVVVPMRRQAGD